ncbi:MAG: tRNA (adenosine(37)-N6)-threonylcarbamoyltransferase complex dimerization subunit type 1 TsaB [Longimicrobiales bacterium]
MTHAGRLTLAIETSTPTGSVAVGRADSVLAEIVLGPESRHSEALLPAIEYLFQLTRSERDQLSQIVVAGGPGSFTGVRIAAATAKGMAAALGLPLLAYSGLLAVAAGTSERDRPICCLFDARRDEVYAACYRLGDRIETISSPQVESIQYVLDALQPTDCVFAGEGALRHTALIEARGARVLPGHLAVPRASALLWLAHTWPEVGRVRDARHWEPQYLRASSAERGIRA